MPKILVVESSARNAEHFRALLAKDRVAEVCETAADGERAITNHAREIAAAIILR
jgi:hypothetical protein